MFGKLFKSKATQPEEPAASARSSSSAAMERRMLPRELPMPDVVESDSDSAWAAFQETPQASETPVPDIAGSKDFDPTMYSDTVPSPGADSRGSTPQEPFISTYKDLIEEIDSEQAELTRQRKQPK